MDPSNGSSGSGSGVRTGGDTPIRFRVLPLRLLVAGRFGLEAGKLHRLDPDGVEGLLDRTGPALALRVDDRMRSDGSGLPLQLRFRHRRDFAAGAVAQAVPDLARVVAAHSTLRSGGNLAEIRQSLTDLPNVHAALTAGASLQPPSPPQPSAAPPSSPTPVTPATESSGDDAIDRLLGMVDGPATGPTAAGSATPPASIDPARAALSGFIAEVTRGSTRPAAAGASPPEALEAVLGDQLDAILNHPDFQAIERSWAALRFLLRRIDLRAAVTVDVIEAGGDTLFDSLGVLVPEDDPDPKGPVRVVVDLNDYDASDRDIARLRQLAEFGASRRAVVLTNAAPDFAGDARTLAAMHDPETRFEEPRFAGWRTLRDTPESGWLGLCLSRIALRDAADGRDDKVLRFAQSKRIGRPLDAGVAPAVAALFAAAAAETDWPCAVGAVTDPALDNLVLAEGGDDGFNGPVRPMPSAGAANSLAAAGLIVLVAERGRDTARLLRIPSVRKAPGRDAADASLIPRLFQAQVVHGLQWNADRLFTPAGHEILKGRVESYLTALISGTGPGAGVDVRLESDEDDAPILAIQLRSGARAAPGASMAFDLPLWPDGAG
jgi:hypothetical protein